MDLAQTHRVPERLQAPRQTACQAVLKGVKRLEWGSLGVMGVAGTGAGFSAIVLFPGR